MTIIAVLWRYGNWRHVATGCTALVAINGFNTNEWGRVRSWEPTFNIVSVTLIRVQNAEFENTVKFEVFCSTRGRYD